MKSRLSLTVAALLLLSVLYLPAQTTTGTPTSSHTQKKGKLPSTATDGLKGKLPAKGEATTEENLGIQKRAGTGLEPAKETEQTIQNAVKKEEFTLRNGTEYKLDKTINLENAASDHPIAVDYQVGSIDQKPAFVTILVNGKEAPTKPEDAEKLFGAKLGGTVHAQGAQSTMSACEGSRICIETQVINAKEVCVRWKCISE
jgi:hypothetical protein